MERNHQTVKKMCARSQKSVVEIENIDEPQLKHEQHVAETENTSRDASCGERQGSQERQATSYLNDYFLEDL